MAQGRNNLESSNGMLNRSLSVPLPFYVLAFMVVGSLYMGLLSKWLFGLGLSVILVGIGTIVTFQESILYIPVINNWRTPADNPSGYHHPGQRSLEYEDVRIETPDGEKIHGWFIPAPRGQDASLAPTVLFCHENAGNIGLRVDEFDHMHKKLKVNQLVFDYRELVKELGVRLSG